MAKVKSVTRSPIGKFVKAIVIDNSDYESQMKLGQVVILDTQSVAKGMYDLLIGVVGSTWGNNVVSRFAIDPLIKVTKEDVYGTFIKR